MIKILFEVKDDLYTSLKIEGHANYDIEGSDIVCAGVSAIGVGGLNALYEVAGYKPVNEMKKGYIFVEFKEDTNSQLIAKTMYVQFKCIEYSYSKYIKLHKKTK